jgi:putative oxidoreductase
MKDNAIDRVNDLHERMDGVGAWLAPLGLRAILAWEFWDAGISKLRGENWFAEVQSSFPFPFNQVPADLNWTLATWAELTLSLALLFGLATRYAAFALFVLTVVAIAAVHWPAQWSSLAELAQGYVITGQGFGNYKLPLIFLAMLLPLMFHGAGKLSLDAAIGAWQGGATERARSSLPAWGLALFALGVPVAMLLPLAGWSLAGIGLALLAFDRVALRA